MFFEVLNAPLICIYWKDSRRFYRQRRTFGRKNIQKNWEINFCEKLVSKYIFLYIDKEPVYKQIALGWQMVKIFH